MAGADELRLKFVVVGDAGVGKTSLHTRINHKEVYEPFVSDIGVDFAVKRVDLGHVTAKIQFWDTAGQERFRAISNAYFRGTHGLMVVFDITSRESFDHVEEHCKNASLHAPDAVKVLVGNKMDLASDQRVVSTDEAQKLADKMSISYWETSAKTSENVEEMFISFVRQVVSKQEQLQGAQTNNSKGVEVKQQGANDQPAGSCC
eukprot:TRINITY_DN2236_c0_g1_i2.p2 TRINITY_DN2236_c0_g1~~TRINITY_DN2236_c0_g1_i2.p2  ORF type:complete len:204 (-),score=38.92 TRINITY_DN2236_c0_g1_i2:1007-1618(-)